MSKTKSAKGSLSQKQIGELLTTIKARFEKNMNRHKDIKWDKVKAKLVANPEALWSLNEMERTGGAIFCDRRYNNVFTYHNAAESYYAARGFRGFLKV